MPIKQSIYKLSDISIYLYLVVLSLYKHCLHKHSRHKHSLYKRSKMTKKLEKIIQPTLQENRQKIKFVFEDGYWIIMNTHANNLFYHRYWKGLVYHVGEKISGLKIKKEKQLKASVIYQESEPPFQGVRYIQPTPATMRENNTFI